MARPLSATDDEILDAARRVLAREGAAGFTIAEVAREVGLSRTAISLRFKTAADLKEVLFNRAGDHFDTLVAELALEPGARGLVEIAELVGRLARGRKNFSAFILDYGTNIEDAGRLRMEDRRGRTLRAAIAKVLPQTALAHDAAVDVFMANLTGSLFAWQSSDEPDAVTFLRNRALDWARLAQIAIPEDLLRPDPIEAAAN